MRNRATCMIRASKSSYLQNDAKQSKSNFWKHLSILKNKQTFNTSTLPVSVDNCNNFFLSIPSDITANLPTYDIQSADYLVRMDNDAPAFTFEEADEDAVCSVISRLDTRKATGGDLIPPLFIKRFHLFFVKPITILVNKSFKMATVPYDWKQANVIPAILKGTSDHSVYRPISVYRRYSKRLLNSSWRLTWSITTYFVKISLHLGLYTQHRM